MDKSMKQRLNVIKAIKIMDQEKNLKIKASVQIFLSYNPATKKRTTCLFMRGLGKFQNKDGFQSKLADQKNIIRFRNT